MPRRIEVLPGKRAKPREESLQSKERASTGVDIWVREDRARPTVAGLPSADEVDVIGIGYHRTILTYTSLASAHG